MELFSALIWLLKQHFDLGIPICTLVALHQFSWRVIYHCFSGGNNRLLLKFSGQEGWWATVVYLSNHCLLVFLFCFLCKKWSLCEWLSWEIPRLPIFALTTLLPCPHRGWQVTSSSSPCQFLELFTKCILIARGDKSVIDSFDRSVSTLVCLHLTSWHDLSIIFDISIYPEIIKSIVSTDNWSIHEPL